MKVPPWPDGTKMKIASGLASAARCRNGEKSGLASGTRIDFDDRAAGRLEGVDEPFLRVEAGRVVGDDGDDFLDLVLRRPIGDDHRTTAAAVKLVRTM